MGFSKTPIPNNDKELFCIKPKKYITSLRFCQVFLLFFMQNRKIIAGF